METNGFTVTDHGTKVSLHLERALRLIGTNEKGQETAFDTSVKGGGSDTAASPMETVLEAVAACMAMDVIPILRKRRKTITDFSVHLTGERAATHPRVFTKIAMQIELVSPDVTMEELTHALELSETTYCSVSAMLRRSGCEIAWEAVLKDSHDGAVQRARSDIHHILN